MRWDKIPPNGTLFLSNPVNTRYRLVIAFTADFPREQVLNFIEFLIFINRRLYHRRLSIQCCYLLSTSEIGMFNVLFLRFPLPLSRWRNILTFHTILVISMVFQIITWWLFMIRHNQFYMPKVNGMLAHLHTDFKSDYYCFINSDILLSSNIFSILDYVDDQISRGIVSPIVCLYKCLVNDWIQFISYHIISYHRLQLLVWYEMSNHLHWLKKHYHLKVYHLNLWKST